MRLVAFLESAQNRDGALDAGLADVNGLEAALERGVLLDVLAILIEGGRANDAQLAPSKHRLQHVASIHRSLGFAGSNDGMELVDEDNELALAFGDFF